MPGPLITEPVAIFTVVLAIILLAPIVLGHFKIPNIIGLIVAGVAVGPWGFNLLGRDMSFEIFGQVGILYLMFLAGLEIDMYHLKKNIGRGLLFGLYTFVIPLLGGLMASHYLLGLDWLASALASAIFSAHTLIGYPIMSRFGLTRTPAVIIAIAATIITVLASLIVLATVTGVYHEGQFRLLTSARLLLWLAIYCAAIGVGVPRLTRWFFKAYPGSIAQFVYVLTVVFVSATVAKMIGIEGVFGAFYAGLTINRYIPDRSPLMKRLEFVGNAIFIPYFLIGVGMLINVRVVFEGWGTLYVAAVMSAVAIAAKWLAAFAAQVSFKMGRIDRSVMYQLTNAHTAVALAVVMIGYNLGTFDDNILNGTVLMILVTCTVASLGVERAASRLVQNRRLGNPGGDSAPVSPTSHTLISLATPITAKQLIDLALLMRTPSTDSKLYALHVRSDNTPTSRAIGRNSLDVARQVATSADTPITPIERFDMNIVTGLLNTIEERDISSIFIGLHRRSGVADTFLGSKIEQLLTATHRMVVISRTFIPLNTVKRIVTVVPQKAQWESGFRGWVESIALLTKQIGCRTTFMCHPDTRGYIASVIQQGRYGIRVSYVDMEQPDDYVLMANKIAPDDLFITIAARRASASYSAAVDDIQHFMQRHMADRNIIVIYPEQRGEVTQVLSIADTVATDMSAPSRLWLSIKALLSRRNRYDPFVDDDEALR